MIRFLVLKPYDVTLLLIAFVCGNWYEYEIPFHPSLAVSHRFLDLKSATRGQWYRPSVYGFIGVVYPGTARWLPSPSGERG